MKIFILALPAFLLCACTSMTVTYPDGRVVKTTSQDPAVVSAIVTGVTNGAIQAGTAYLKSEQGLSK